MGKPVKAPPPKTESASELETERQLVEAAQQDSRRFAELFERHAYRVYAFVARRVRNREDAEDVTSEVFHQALANLKQYEWRGVPFSAWLYRIAENAIAQRGRVASREILVAEEAAPEPAVDADAERKAMLFQLVEKLPPDQARVVALRYTQQKSVQEIAEEMNRSEAAVKMLHLRALENLRKYMEGRHG